MIKLIYNNVCDIMKDDKIKQKEEQLIQLVSKFCQDMLDREYEDLAVKLVEKMGRKHDVPFKRGKLDIWASAVIYALAQVNFLFDKSFEPYISADDICNYYNTKKSTVSDKARRIREMFGENKFYSEFSSKSIKEEIPSYVLNNEGFMVPASGSKILFAKAFMHFEEGKIDEALAVLDSIEQDNPDYPKAKFYKEYILKESGRNKEISHGNVDLNDFDDVFADAMKNYRLENFKEAINLFNNALKLKPNDLDSLYNLSLSYAGDLDIQAAVETLDLAIDINPNDPRFWNDKGNYLGVLGNFEEAIDCFDKAIELHQDETVWNNKAFMYAQMNEYDNALKAYEIASKMAPMDIHPIVGMVKVFIMKDDLENVKKYLKIAESIDSENMGYLAVLPHLYIMQDNFREAIKCIDKYLKINSDSGEMWILKAMCHARLQERKEYEKAIEKAFEVDPMAMAEFSQTFNN